MTLLSMNFSNLTAEGYSAFVLALLFTVVCISCFIYCAKHERVNKIVAVLSAIVFPFLSVFCWVYLIMNLSNCETLFSLGIALASGVGYIVIAGIATIIVLRVKRDESPKSRADVRDEDEPGVVNQKESQETAEEDTNVLPLLIAQSLNEESEKENTDEVEEAEVDSVEETEETEEVEADAEDVEKSENEEVSEETVEASEVEDETEETVENEENQETEASEEVEEQEAEEIDEDVEPEEVSKETEEIKTQEEVAQEVEEESVEEKEETNEIQEENNEELETEESEQDEIHIIAPDSEDEE